MDQESWPSGDGAYSEPGGSAAGSTMLGAFYSWSTGALEYEEVFLDIVQGRMNPLKRC